MLIELGHFCAVLALAVQIFQTLMPVYGLYKRDIKLMATATRAAIISFILLSFSFLSLIYSYAVSDFSVLNVAENSFSEKPMLFKITGVWGNHEGSMLLWVFILCLFSALFSLLSRSLDYRSKTLTLASQGAIASAFLIFILATSNPFVRLSPPALQGQDVNPILQDIGLAIHPPLLYLGYVGFSLCFSLAVAALILGEVTANWARSLRPWALLSWIFLTGGIAMGSYWAYYELGWGGYWFWDPVENASLMPWLAGTALIHSIIVLQRRGALKSWTLFLALLTFALSLIGTFLVRSGILTSVHSFATDPSRGTAILIILVVFIGGALLLFAMRARELSNDGSFQPISREGTLVFSNMFLTCALFTVFIGTLYPLVLETLTNEKISVGPPFFEMTFIPLMLPVLILMPFGPMLAWKRGSLGKALSKLSLAFIVLLVAAVIFFGKADYRSVIAAVSFGIGCFIIAGALTDLWYKTGIKKTPLSLRCQRFCGLRKSIFGTALAHIGLGFTLLGIVAVSVFGKEKISQLALGESLEIAGKSLQYIGASDATGANFSERRYQFLLIDEAMNTKPIEAAKRFYPAQKMPTTVVGLLSEGFSQFYVSPGNERHNQLIVDIWWKPQVIFIWFGAIVMMAGGGLSLFDLSPADKRKESFREP